MAVASQQITVKVDPLKEPKEEQREEKGRGKTRDEREIGGKAGEERRG